MGSYADRLHAVIPGGAHTYSRGDDQFPSSAPEILARGKGAYVYDVRGKKYLDYGMGLRSVTIGYADERVNAGAVRGMNEGVNLSRPALMELEAAERLADLLPWADMVKFAKHGSSVNSAAAKIARAITGRRFVCVPRQHPFFSFDDWFIGTTPIKRGIPAEHTSSTLLFDYNDLNSLRKCFAEQPDSIAAVMLEPATTVGPCSTVCGKEFGAEPKCWRCPEVSRNFLHEVKALCRKEGALFILDEMITGFRFNLRGAGAYFGVEPDLATFGKAMANGFPLAAVVGKREFMDVGGIRKSAAERTFLMSTTHGSELTALGAFLATMDIYEKDGVIDHLWRYGRKLYDGFNDIAAAHGIAEYLQMEGFAVSMSYVAKGPDKQPSLAYRTLFAQELASQNVLMPWVSFSQSHSETELAQTFEAIAAACKRYAQALESGVDKFLLGPAIKPVFRQFN